VTQIIFETRESKQELDSESLRNFYARGIIAGPDESEEDFLGRTERLKPKTNSPLSFIKKNKMKPIPDWVSIQFNNKGLFPWQGGCVSIDRRVILQLRKEFRFKERYLTYGREEILAHESIHALRMVFNEPIFEEILAYQTSDSKFRRFFGPIFRTSRESLVFLAALMILNIFNFLYPIAFWTFSLFFGGVGYGIYRLNKFQKMYHKCFKKLTIILQKDEDAKAIMIALKDDEIMRFSKLTTTQIRQFIREEVQHSLRWKQLFSVFLENKL
jgi:hypothetical protein